MAGGKKQYDVRSDGRKGRKMESESSEVAERR